MSKSVEEYGAQKRQQLHMQKEWLIFEENNF